MLLFCKFLSFSASISSPCPLFLTFLMHAGFMVQGMYIEQNNCSNHGCMHWLWSCMEKRSLCGYRSEVSSALN